MAEKKNQADFLQKAAISELLEDYNMYSNPNLHIYDCLENLNKALVFMSNEGEERILYTDADVRFLHAVYDTSIVDVYVNSNLILSKFPFQKVSDYIALPSGAYCIAIFSSLKPTEKLLCTNVKIEGGKVYTLAFAGIREKPNLLTVENLPSVPFGESKMRFLHLAPATAPLDFAVKDRDVVFPNVSFRSVTDYLGLTPMTVDLELRRAGTKQVVLPMPKLQFKANYAYTVVLMGPETDLSITILID